MICLYACMDLTIIQIKYPRVRGYLYGSEAGIRTQDQWINPPWRTLPLWTL